MQGHGNPSAHECRKSIIAGAGCLKILKCTRAYDGCVGGRGGDNSYSMTHQTSATFSEQAESVKPEFLGYELATNKHITNPAMPRTGGQHTTSY